MQENVSNLLDKVLMITHTLSEVFAEENRDEKRIIHALLVAITSGESLGFNRAFAMLIDEVGNLKPVMVVGPKNKEEAYRIWEELQGKRLEELIKEYSEDLVRKETEKFRDLMLLMYCPKKNWTDKKCVLSKILNGWKAVKIKISSEDGEIPEFLKILNVEEVAIAPLKITDRATYGIVIADNFITKKEITENTLKILETYALQTSLALSKLYYIRELDKYYRKFADFSTKTKLLKVLGPLNHSMKNKVAAIGGLVSILDKQTPEHDHRRELFEILKEETRELEETLNDINLLLKKETQGLRWEKIELCEFLENFVSKRYKLFSSKNIKIVLELPEIRDIFMHVEPNLLKEAIDNLLFNSLEALPEGGVIIIKVKKQRDGIHLWIKDNGKGIPQEIQSRIFEKGFTTKSNGWGQGLFYVKEIIESFGGSIELENSVPGKGTVFHIRFPSLITGL